MEVGVEVEAGVGVGVEWEWSGSGVGVEWSGRRRAGALDVACLHCLVESVRRFGRWLG